MSQKAKLSGSFILLMAAEISKLFFSVLSGRPDAGVRKL
jgi:hypothetical protein